MRPTIVDSGKPLASSDIDAAERKMKLSLPRSYRAFLAAHNGGVPEPNVWRPREASVVIDFFFEIGAREKFRDLVRSRKLFRKRIPAGAIPVALDAFGNLICLAANGEHAGKLYFWDHEMPRSDDDDIEAKYPELFDDLEDDENGDDCDVWPGWPTLTLVAETLDEFLDGFVDES